MFQVRNEDIVYASSGKEVKSFDVEMIACNSKSSFVACANNKDDVKIIDTRQHCLCKTLRAGHSSVYSCLLCNSFLGDPGKMKFLFITGGLDSRLLVWDFSKGRQLKIIDFGLPDINSTTVVKPGNVTTLLLFMQ